MTAQPAPFPETALDAALQRMAAAPDETAARLALHAELSRAELFVLLEAEARDGALEPRVFDLSDGRAVLAFDSEMRLAGFAGEAAYAALPGRVLVSMLVDAAAAGEPLSLLLNPDAEHAGLFDPQALGWLAETLAAPAPAEAEAVPESFGPPELPEGALALLVPALERRLSGMPGLALTLLAGVRWQGGGRGHVLALGGLPEAAQAPVARAVAEALALSGLEAGALDVIFPPEPVLARLARLALRLEPAPYAAPEEQSLTPGANPGMDPSAPPKLR